MRGKGGYVGADGVPRLNVLDLQVLCHDSSIPFCLHAALLALKVILFCILFALHTSKHQTCTAVFSETLEGALLVVQSASTDPDWIGVQDTFQK